MASLIDELIDVLNEECEIYEALLAVSDEKTRVIVAGDINRLQEITNNEQNTVDKVNALEKRRAVAVGDIATVLNKKPQNMTIKDIIAIMESQPQVQKQLIDAHKRIKDVVGKLQNINNHNRILLEESLEMTEFSINMLQNTRQAPETANYGKGTYRGDTLGATKSMFDTSQ